MPIKNKALFIYKFIFWLTVTLIISYFLQFYVLKIFNNHSGLITSYSLNGTIAILVFYLLIFVMHKNSLSAIYAFLAGTAIKLTAYFVVFYPVFKADGKITKPEFFTFFLPYAVSLFIEIIFLAQHLKQPK